jgi:hypothetical protein
MVVVETREELMHLIRQGFKPYYHKGVKRWYLRKGHVRHIIARSLDAEAGILAEKLRPTPRRVPEYKVAEAVKMRLEGAPVSTIVEETGISRSTLYEKFDKYDKGEISLKNVEGSVQKSLPKSIAVQAASVTVPEVAEIGIPGEILRQVDGFLKWISKSSEDAWRIIQKYLSEPENIKDVTDLLLMLSGLIALHYYQTMGIDPKPIYEMFRDIAKARGLWQDSNRA